MQASLSDTTSFNCANEQTQHFQNPLHEHVQLMPMSIFPRVILSY